MEIPPKQTLSPITHRFSKEVWILILLPFVLLLVNPSLFVSNPFHSKVDSWIYYGYFQNLPQHLKLFTSFHGYFGDRLAFIIPGYLINRIFQPGPADFILHLGFYYVSIWALYSLMKMEFGKRVAFVTSILFGTYHYNLWMFSWNHVDGPVNAYFLLTMLLFAKTARGPRRLISAAFSGVAFSCMIFASFQAVKLAPGMAIFFALLLFFAWKDQAQTLREVGMIILSCILGTIGMSILFSAINYELTGDFHVLRQTFEFAKWLYEVYQVTSEITSEEVLRAYWLILPGIIISLTLVVVIRQVVRRRFETNRMVILYSGCFLAMLLTFFLTTIKSAQFGIFVMAPCQFSYINGGMFLALGGLISIPVGKWRLRTAVVLTVIVLIVFIVPTAMIKPRDNSLPTGPKIVARAMAAIKEVDPEGRVHFILNAPEKDLANKCGNLNFTISGSQDDLTELYHNIASTYLWEQAARLLSNQVTVITNEWALRSLRRTDKILVLSSAEGDVTLAQQALAKYGIGTTVVSQRRIQEKEIGFTMVFLTIN